MTIIDAVYDQYLDHLLKGDRATCSRIVQDLLDRDVDLKTLYTDLFQKSLYRVGELWEFNRISVAREHLATAITEGLLSATYPRLFQEKSGNTGRKVVISCAANEFHQIGGKIVADMFELHGWDSHFLGANTPVEQTLAHIQEVSPDLVGLSLSIYFNLDALKSGLKCIQADFPQLDILVGGQAFRWGGIEAIKRYRNTEYIPGLDELEHAIQGG